MNTSEIAKIVGCHPNTIRNYEKWGLISQVPRGCNGYRKFDEKHLNQAILVKLAFNSTWLGGDIQKTALNIIRLVKNELFHEALSETKKHIQLIKNEKKLAIDAIETLKIYAKSDKKFTSENHYSISEVSKMLNISIYTIRDWERDQLISIPRKKNGYRIFRKEEINRLKIIHVLRKAKYSIMIIMKMLHSFDLGRKDHFKELMTTHDENIFFATDSWLETLESLESNAQKILKQIKKMNPPTLP